MAVLPLAASPLQWEKRKRSTDLLKAINPKNLLPPKRGVGSRMEGRGLHPARRTKTKGRGENLENISPEAENSRKRREGGRVGIKKKQIRNSASSPLSIFQPPFPASIVDGTTI